MHSHKRLLVARVIIRA